VAVVSVIRAALFVSVIVAGRPISTLGTFRTFRTALDDFIEFAAIQPDAAAFWAIVNLNPLTFGHHQVDSA